LGCLKAFFPVELSFGSKGLGLNIAGINLRLVEGREGRLVSFPIYLALTERGKNPKEEASTLQRLH